MSQKEVWNKYITEQFKIIEKKFKPIGIDTSKQIQLDELKLNLTIVQEIFKQVFVKEVMQIFNLKLVRELIDQVYQFSRMYWKSISQQSLPVTTLYPEMVAEMYPHFENEHLSDFGKKSLLFN
jgi:hypothetical protein